MHHISTHIPVIKQSRGGRKSSPKLRTTIEQSQSFEGLDTDTNRYDLLLLVKRVGKEAGFTPKMIQLLDYYMGFTRDIDWEQGSQPIIYQSLSRTALDLCISERQVQRLEKALFGAGALTWNDSGNHKRFGRRDPKTGVIIFGYGVDLTPLAYLKEDLQEKYEEKQLYDQSWMETKRQISWYRAQIRSLFADLEEQGREIEDFGTYESISGSIRTHMPLESLRELLNDHKDLYQQTLKNVEITQKESPRDDRFDVHKHITNQKPFNKLNTRRPSSNGFQESCSQVSEEKTDRAGQRDRSLDPEEELILKTGLQHITLKQVLNTASEEFRGYIPINPGERMNFADIGKAASKRKYALHISQKSWDRACVLLGESGASICVLLTDQATQRPEDPVRKPAAYFNAMITRAESGELNLQKSVFGLLKKDNGQN